LISILATNACTAKPSEVTEWDIHILLPLTGGYAGYGQEVAWAIKDSEQQVNDSGGILGKPINCILHDTQSEPTVAHAETAAVLDTKPLMMALSDGEPQGYASGELFVNEKVFCVMPFCGMPCNSTFEPWTTAFMNWDESLNGPAEAKWLEHESDIKRIVPIFDAMSPAYYNLSRLKFKYMQEMLGMDVEPLEPVTFEMFTTTDFGPVAVAALEQDADGYILTATGDPCAKTIVEMNRRGMTENRRIFINYSSDYPELYEIGEGFLDDCYISSFFWIDNPAERWQATKARYEAYTDTPIGFGLLGGSDIPYMFKRSYEACGITGDPDKLVEEREKLAVWCYNIEDFEFVDVTCDVVNGVRMSPLWLSRIENNQKVLLDRVDLPTARPYKLEEQEWDW
jgi:branched-chain amino acid transport system substrate-binding protein